MGFYYSPPDWHHPDFFTTNQARYVDYFHGQVRELLTRYGPIDELWFDTTGGINTPETWDNQTLFPMIRKLQPEIMVTKRCGGWGDFETPEQHIGGFNNQQPWETCMTICRQWSWKPDDQLKSLAQCIHTLATCAGGDGNLLLNVGPRPDGTIEPRQVVRLKEIGAWLKRNGASIYETRGGPWKPGAYGVSTREDKTIYVHVFKWPGEFLSLPAIDVKIKSARILGGDRVTVSQGDAGVIITVPAAQQDPIDTIVALKLDRPALSVPVVDTSSR